MPNREVAEEFEAKHGVPAGNAEKLVRAIKSATTQEMREAARHRLDPVATNALDMEKLGKLVKDKGKLRSASVRGPFVVALVLCRDKRSRKVILSRDDVINQAEEKAVEEKSTTTGPKKPASTKKVAATPKAATPKKA